MTRMHSEAPWSPLSSQREQLRPGSAAMRWACGRRGRVAIVTLVLFVVVVLTAGARRPEALTSSYRTLSSNLDHFSAWRPHLPHIPSSIPTSLRKPSNTAIQLENGTMTHVPDNLHKSSPNFHLLLSSLKHDIDFCRTTMSAMIMNYPPPTIVSPLVEPAKMLNWEVEKLKGVLVYLQDTRVVKDNDLIMLVEGRDTWFQLPSELMIRQYMDIVADANRRLKKEYNGAFAQTIIFGAKKTCEDGDVACRHMPPPQDVYRTGERTAKSEEVISSRYLDAETLIGPVKDLKQLFRAALPILTEGKSQYKTVQSTFETLFAEQMLARQIHKKKNQPTALKMYHQIAGALNLKGSEDTSQTNNLTLLENGQYEYSIGLDYTHALFQPLVNTAANELVPTNSTRDDGSLQEEDGGMSGIASDLPSIFANATRPFWRLDESSLDPSPNDKPAYIDKLEYKYGLDKLPRRDTPWTKVSLIKNAYTGTIPATLHNVHTTYSPGGSPTSQAGSGNLFSVPPRNGSIGWTTLWYAGYERALLRRYFRTPQSPMGYHTAAVGGDLLWDQRGGRGGIWTADYALWFPWGEVDGVCGTYELISNVFGDEKGVWFHEDEEGGGKKGRQDEEVRLREHMQEERRKDEEWKKKMEEERLQKERLEKEERERTQRERENEERERLEREQRVKEEADRKATEDAAMSATASLTAGEVTQPNSGDTAPAAGTREGVQQAHKHESQGA